MVDEEPCRLVMEFIHQVANAVAHPFGGLPHGAASVPGRLGGFAYEIVQVWQRRWTLPKAPWAICPASVSENQVMNVLIPGSRAATRSHSLLACCSRSGLYGVDADRWYPPLWSVRRESPWPRGGCSAILRLPRTLGYTPFWNTAFAGMKQFWQGFLRLLNPGVENRSPVLSPSSVLGLGPL